MYSKNILFLCFAHALLGTIFINNIFGYEFSFQQLIIIGVVFFIFFFYKKQYGIYLSIILLGGIFGIYISQINIQNISEKNNILQHYHKQKDTYILEIQDITKKEAYKNQYLAKITSINNNKIGDDIMLILHLSNSYTLNIGDIVQTESKLYILKNSPDFQYKDFMNSKNIFASMNMYNFDIIGKKSRNILSESAQNIRSSFLDIIYKIYPKNEAIFLGGILLGARESLPDTIKQNFNNSGLTHFIAVSGFNITILIIFIGFLVKYFPQYIQIGIIIFSIVFFVYIVGSTAPVIRAALMGGLGYIILTLGRKSHPYSLLIFTALIMVILSPYTLNYDVSFHLSFLAVLGIIFTQDFYKKVFSKVTQTLAIQEALILTFSALTFTLPLMLFNFGQVSILSPFANISVTWTIPIAMLLGFISIIVYFVSPFLGICIGYFTWLLLKFDMLMVDFFGNLEFSVFRYDFGIYKNEFLILYFIISVFILLMTRKKEG